MGQSTRADVEALATCRAIVNASKQPPRGPLPTDVERAAHRIHREVWGTGYQPGQGPLHHAGGGYWRCELVRRAERWEQLAADARLCAEVLPYE